MSSISVTFPTSLTFLVSNFQSLVNVKLSGANYLLWRIQVENVLNANGFFGYLDGTNECPPSKIKNSEGNLVDNPDFAVWTVVDTQLMSCLTSSLSQTTLPYVLGLRHAKDVWDSLSKRYNSLTRSHVQELKCRLFSHTKTESMEKYIDSIKEFAQKLAAAGRAIDEDDLVFHTLRGLPPAFNGFRTAIRTRGTPIVFNELVAMLTGEDQQMSKDLPSDHTTVLVATSEKGSNQGYAAAENGLSNSMSYLGITTKQPVSSDSAQPFVTTQFFPQQQPSSAQFRGNNNRGRGGRGPRYFKDPCAICGHNNHTTNYCYYKNNSNGYDNSGGSWRGNASSSYQNVSPSYLVQHSSGYPLGNTSVQVPQMFTMPQMYHMPPVQVFAPQPQISTSWARPNTQGASGPQMIAPPQQARPGGFGSAFTGPQPGSTSQSPVFVTPPFAGFTAAYQPQAMVAGSSGGSTLSFDSSVSTHGSADASQPWFFDSGATHHVTNNLNNITQSQPASLSEGVLVGNGSTIPVTHTGQVYSQAPIQGTLSQGALPNSELL